MVFMVVMDFLNAVFFEFVSGIFTVLILFLEKRVGMLLKMFEYLYLLLRCV